MGLTASARRTRLGLVASALLVLSACGGGGGGGGSDATAQSGSGASAPQPILTSPSTPALPANNAAVLNCPTTSSHSVSSPPAVAAGAIVGRISFERVPFSSRLGEGLDYSAIVTLPARGVVVEAVAPSTSGNCDGAVLAAALTDGDGWYRLAPGSGDVCVRARAQLYRAAEGSSAVHWNFAVADNTDADKLYLLSEAAAATAAARPRRDLHAASGWSGGSYTAARNAAPFAILDTTCKAMNATSAAVPAAQFGAMTYFWSTRNTSDDSGTLAEGKIGGAFFSPDASAIYLRGDAAVDTDEFDEMLIAHEFAHFVSHRFSRSDSIGGEHSLLDELDPRLAFEEGWATAFAGLVLGTQHYRDSNQLTSWGSLAREFHFNIQSRYGNTPTGWYAETSVQRALFNIGADAGFGGLGVGLDGLLRTLSGVYKTTPAMTTLFSYGSQLKSEQPTATAGAIASILNSELMNGDDVQPFADAETNAHFLG